MATDLTFGLGDVDDSPTRLFITSVSQILDH